VEEIAQMHPIRRVKLGDVVRYVRTVDPGDEQCRFVVTEDNGDRLMIKLICELPIPPVCVVPRCEVTRCD
jgi:hypothetical protein